jgi:hypothetical protein
MKTTEDAYREKIPMLMDNFDAYYDSGIISAKDEFVQLTNFPFDAAPLI